jgi:transcriptional regulator with XRE-family HTH domain
MSFRKPTLREILERERIRAGFDLDKVAEKLMLAVEVVVEWEKNPRNIPAYRITELATLYEMEQAVIHDILMA